MDKDFYRTLAAIRIERAQELLKEAQDLLIKDSYKSANNRAFYSIEKAVKALLATAETEAMTHAGVLKQFNFLFVYKGDGTFTADDYQKIAHAEQIRNASDYDDFYIASKDETRQQVKNAVFIVDKIQRYINNL